jgi:hypothetical protein
VSKEEEFHFVVLQYIDIDDKETTLILRYDETIDN